MDHFGKLFCWMFSSEQDSLIIIAGFVEIGK